MTTKSFLRSADQAGLSSHCRHLATSIQELDPAVPNARSPPSLRIAGPSPPLRPDLGQPHPSVRAPPSPSRESSPRPPARRHQPPGLASPRLAPAAGCVRTRDHDGGRASRPLSSSSSSWSSSGPGAGRVGGGRRRPCACAEPGVRQGRSRGVAGGCRGDRGPLLPPVPCPTPFPPRRGGRPHPPSRRPGPSCSR